MIITTERDTTISLKRRDEWVVAMVIDQPCPGGGKCLSRITFTIDSLLTEIAQLDYPKPEDWNQGAENENPT